MAVCLIAFMILSTPVKAATTQTVMNAIQWADTNGNPIQAHGGGMIKAGSYYYWFGENRDDTGHFQGVSCYRSTNLKNWTYIRDVLTKNSASELNDCWIVNVINLEKRQNLVLYVCNLIRFYAP